MITSYFLGESPVGSSDPAFVDIPTCPPDFFVTISSIDIWSESSTGLRDLGRKYLTVSRYPADMDGADRDGETPLTNFTIPIAGPRTNHIDWYRVYQAYNSVAGLTALQRQGFRCALNDKARASDYQRIQIGVLYQTFENLSRIPV